MRGRVHFAYVWGETNWRGFLKREMSVAEGGSYICIKRVSCYRVIDRRPVKECDGSQGGFTANQRGVGYERGGGRETTSGNGPEPLNQHYSATALPSSAIISRASVSHTGKTRSVGETHNAHLTILHRVLSNSDDRKMQ